ncbi:MAG: Na/Pi cotransporter family protein [Colwellia sp.]|nr:Na/Pi cotransporter family protein [Colwellia sp.]
MLHWAASQITYENALALAIGANVGTTITAILGAMSSAIAGKRLAGAHLIFNLATGLIAIVFINQFMQAVDWTSAKMGIANDNYTLKLAVFHTIFNLVGVLVMLPFIDSLVVLLEKKIKDKPTKMVGAKYLHTTSVEFPETAVEVIRKETINIFELSSNILTAGISLNMADVAGKQSLQEIVQQSTKVIELDLDDEYETKIKGIYSEIIAFISKAAFTWEVEQSASIHWLRLANQNIVEAVKDMKHLRKNMSKNIGAKNKHIREQYNLLRIQIAIVLRELDRLKHQIKKEGTVILSLDALKLTVKANHDKLNVTIIKLLQKKKITPAMATSLMNDSQYALRIATNLIAMGGTLFASYDEDDISLEREVALSPQELEKIALTASNT